MHVDRHSQERAAIEAAAKTWAQKTGLPFVDTRSRSDISTLIGRMTPEGMREYGAVPLRFENDTLVVGISQSTDRSKLPGLADKLLPIKLAIVGISQEGWLDLHNRLQRAEMMQYVEQGLFERFRDRLVASDPKAQFILIAQLAYLMNASDIHIEAARDNSRIRFRIDGVLHAIVNLPQERYELLTSDLQMRAGVKWNSDAPQAGRLTLTLINEDDEEIPVSMRLETIPSLHGQDAVVRIFNLGVKFLNIESLRLHPLQHPLLEQAMRRTGGMILAAGPTGSGKTTTLYAILNQLNSPQKKLVTLEDPVEYELDGVVQLPVRTEESELFQAKLRAVLREDPDTVMIGEIRDVDTARTAIQASLTGHLVLSTFHASNTASAVTRLTDMVQQNLLIASALRLIVAHRLVRKLCTDCRESYAPSKEEMEQIKAVLHDLPEEARRDRSDITLWRAKGCSSCFQFGYRGRIPLFEMMPVTEDIEDMISHGTANMTARALRARAVQNGMMTLVQDGVLKALEGETTLAEVFTAVDND